MADQPKKPGDDRAAEALGERIKLVRNGRSQEEFARSIGVHKNTLSNYETGNRVPDALVLLQIWKEASDVNPGWLLTGQGDPGIAAGGVREGRASYSYDAHGNINETVLTQTLQRVYAVSKKMGFQLDDEKKAQVINTLYQMAIENPDLSDRTIEQVVRLAKS